MGHPKINAPEHFVFAPLFVTDEEHRSVLTCFIKNTQMIGDSGLTVAGEQTEQVLDVVMWGEPESSSQMYESETAFLKVSTDVVLIGHATSNTPATFVDVGLRVGTAQKIARVFGDRWWVKRSSQVAHTKPAPFTRIPLIYERAFGGWDRADKDENNWRYEPRNPVGVGFGDPLRFVEEGKVPMPNIEDPQHLINHYGDTPPPAGFGFISPNWQARARYAGTYDEEWDKTRKPLLPKDFDRRFFNAASPGLIAPGYLRGDEDVLVVNASPVPKLKFKLPGIPPPVCKVVLRGGRTEVLQTNLDTVIINTDEMLVFLLWRNYMHVPNGPHDVMSIDVTTERELQTAATV